MRNAFAAIITTSILATSVTSADSLPSFQGLGVLSGGNNSWAYGVSGDGTTVVGCSQSTPGPQAFRWTADEGMIGLGDLPGGGHTSRGTRVSTDGSVVVGNAWYQGECTRTHAFRWTAAEGVVDLGTFVGPCGQSFGLGVSADGSVVVGSSETESYSAPFRWTGEEGMVTLSGIGRGGGGDVSADGRVVVGNRPHGAGSEAFLWTEETGPVGLGDLPGAGFFSFAYAVSSDGRVVVGESDSSGGGEAFRWTEGNGMVGLGFLWYDIPGWGCTEAWDTNTDGSVVVGYGVIDIYGTHGAFVWDEEHGMRNLQDVLQDECGLDLTGWHLLEATGVSDDGLTIVGYGDGPAGRREAWIVHIPEPSCLILAVVAAFLVCGSRKGESPCPRIRADSSST